MVSDGYEEHKKIMRTVARGNDNVHKWFLYLTLR